MLYHILAVGDVVGEPGLRHLEKHLRALKKLKGIDFTVVNGENAANVGLTEKDAWRIYDAGADAVTLGNHTFGKMQITSMLEDTPWLLRPANYTGRAPGHGCEIFDLGAVRIRVMNLIGRCDLAWGAENPFTTADERVYPKGTGYITDLGMTGAVESVLGIEPWQSVETFLGGLPGRYKTPEGACKLQGAVFTLDSETGLCTAVERVDIR